MPTVAELSVDLDITNEQRVITTLDRLDERLRRLDGNDTEIPLSTDADDAQADIAWIQDALFNLSNESVNIPLEVDNIQSQMAELAALERQLDELERQVDAGIDLDVPGTLSELGVLKAALEELQRNPVNIDLDMGSASAKIVALEAALKAIPDETVTVEIDVDRNGVITDRLKNITSASSRASTQISAMVTALLVLGPALAPLLAVALAVTGALGVGLVAAGAGAAIFGAVAVTNFQRVSEALTKMDTLQKAYNTAVTDKQRDAALEKMKALMDSLEPSERAMFAGIVALKTAWKDFAATFQPDVFSLAGRGMQLMAGLFPGLTSLMQGMVIAANNLFDSLENSLNSPFLQQFGVTISNIAGPIFENFIKGLGNIVVGLLGMLDAFSPISVSFSNGFVKMTAAFRDWAIQLGSSQGFQNFMNFVRANTPLAIGFVKSLWSALVELVQALAPLGVQVLSSVKGVLDFITKLGQTHPMILTVTFALAGMLAGFINLLGPILSVISVFTRLGALIGLAGGWLALIVIAIVAVVAGLIYAYNHFETFRNIVNAVFTSIVAVVQAAIPIIAQVFQTLVQWGQVAWAWLVSTFGPAISTVIQFVLAEFNKFKDWFTQNQSILTAFWQFLVEEISGAWTAIVTIVQIGAQFVIDFITGAWGGLVNIVQGLWTAISGVISGAFEIIRGIIQVFAAIIAGDWGALWNGLVTILSGVWTAISGIVMGAIQVLIGLFQVLWAALVAIWNALWSALQAILGPTIEWLKSIWQSVYDFLVGNSIIPDLVNGIIQWFTQLSNFVTQIFTAIGNFITQIWTTIVTWVTEKVTSLYNKIVEVLNQIQATWTAAWTTIHTFLASLWQQIVTTVSEKVRLLLVHIVQFIQDAKQRWTTFWTEFNKIIQDGVEKVVAFFKDMGTRVLDGLNALKDLMVRAGAALVSGLIEGLQSMLGPLGDAIGTVAGVLSAPLPGSPAEIGPLSGSGYTMYRGQRLVEDLATGIASREPSLSATMRDIADLATLSTDSRGAYNAITGGGGSVYVAAGAVQVHVGAGADADMVREAVSQAGDDLAAQINEALRRR